MLSFFNKRPSVCMECVQNEQTSIEGSDYAAIVKSSLGCIFPILSDLHFMRVKMLREMNGKLNDVQCLQFAVSSLCDHAILVFSKNENVERELLRTFIKFLENVILPQSTLIEDDRDSTKYFIVNRSLIPRLKELID